MILLQDFEEELNEVVNDETDYTEFYKTLTNKEIVKIGMLQQFLGGVSIGIDLSHQARKMEQINPLIESISGNIQELKGLLKIADE